MLGTYCPRADREGSLISTPPLRWIKWDRRRWRKFLKVYNIDHNYVKHQIHLIWFRWADLRLIWRRWVKNLIKDQINRQRNTSLVYSVYICMNKWIIRVTSHPPLLHSLSHTETPQQARVNTQISLHSCWWLKSIQFFKKENSQHTVMRKQSLFSQYQLIQKLINTLFRKLSKHTYQI